MLQPKARESIKAFSLQASDERLGESIRRNLDHPTIRPGPEVLHLSFRELPIAAPDQSSCIDPFVVQLHTDVSKLLHDPRAIRVQGWWGSKRQSGFKMDKPNSPTKRPNLLREEIARNYAVDVALDELRPGNGRKLAGFLRVGEILCLAQDSSNCHDPDLDAQLFQLAYDPAVSLKPIFPTQPLD